MIKNVYFLYNYSINCWGRIDPEAQKCKQETKNMHKYNLHNTLMTLMSTILIEENST